LFINFIIFFVEKERFILVSWITNPNISANLIKFLVSEKVSYITDPLINLDTGFVKNSLYKKFIAILLAY